VLEKKANTKHNFVLDVPFHLIFSHLIRQIHRGTKILIIENYSPPKFTIHFLSTTCIYLFHQTQLPRIHRLLNINAF